MNIETIIELYTKQKYSLAKLEELTGISRPTLKKRLQENGVVIRSVSESKSVDNSYIECPDIEKLKQLVSEGKSISAIVKDFSVYQGLVQKWLDKEGLKTKSNKYMKKDIPSKEQLQSYVNQDMTYDNIAKELGVSYPTLMKWLKSYDLIRDEGSKYKIMSDSISENKLEKYGYPHFPSHVYDIRSSKGESNLKDYLNSIGGNFKKIHFISDDGERRELDMYDDNLKLAIEYSGAYWHSEINQPDKLYHYKKMKYCRDNGILLLTFWDLEIAQREEQILSFIRSKMGIFERRLHARNLQFKELSFKQHDFFEENHIQGRASIDRNFALLDDNEIVGCVSFSNHHREANKYVLNRLAFKRGVQVIGGVGKLIKNSLHELDREIITWSDNRYSNGKIYQKNGFFLDEHLKPDYCYFDIKKDKLLSKQSQKKSVTGCPNHVSEKDFCASLGRYRLWDCGKIRWKYTPK